MKICYKYFFFLILTFFASFFACRGLRDKDLPLHPNSPREKIFRIKRQAYQVNTGGELAISVNKNGHEDAGPWEQWTLERECSRTCGGGVQVEKRACGGSECTGPSVRYVSCNIALCPEGSVDFRAKQCASHNDSPLDGKYFKWMPYAGKNKCELTCKPETANFYYKWADKVVDGTRCDNFGDDICVDGICLSVGCDERLGSEAKNDKCGVCGGNGTQCKSVEGNFYERNLAPGYHEITVLPIGATSIKVEELQPTTNSLAIKNASGHFFLNGDFRINLLDKNIKVAGTTFKYRKSNDEGQTEQLTANGPLKEPITIALLLQRGGQKSNSVVKYEFSIPLERDVKHLYKYSEWAECSVTCGQGLQKRDVFCVEQATGQRVNESICDEQNATKPIYEKLCKTVDCEPSYFTGEWEPCSQSCGASGLQFRTVYCYKIFADGRQMTISDQNCTKTRLERPNSRQTCNRFACPEWDYGPWSACSQQCGDAMQYRSVTCRSEKEGEEAKLLAAEACGSQVRQTSERECNLGPCEGLKFYTSNWQLCQRCNDTVETRNVTCANKNNRLYPLEKCQNNITKDIPVDSRPCATQPPCIYEWHTSQWSKCSTECGFGHRKRRVFCAIAEVGEVKPVFDGLCFYEKPNDKEECVNEEKCTGTYFTSPWSECTEKCGGGKQNRTVVCLNYDKKPVPEWCDEKMRPLAEQECNTKPCPNCTNSEFGCCADNITFASGLNLKGCSNCSAFEFGCCADNVTEALDKDKKGCLEYVEVEVEGSGDEPEEEKEKICEIIDTKGEKLQIPCASTIAPTLVDEIIEKILGAETNETAELNITAETNETAATSVTIHCSKTSFGCCSDWHTPAGGKNFKECPTYILGTCNATEFGCCSDNITLARGRNLEGCGDPTCAASLYGCCKDRKTIAFGPHYEGCDRSSFPCELSQFGCCSDGETAALGLNGTGCGSNCLVTKFGCCPDGVTYAKGPSNEGCGCEFAQFGCCPDGKTSAKGPGYYGCPESCARSPYGCCPDGKQFARGPNKEGCPCQYTRWGCCPDGETTALGSANEGCDDCRYSKYGCCPDETTKAGPDNTGCPSTTPPSFIKDGTVSPSTIVSCGLLQDPGHVCQSSNGYKLMWFYNVTEGRCTNFWYGGCGGNENRFSSEDQCEQVCIEPPHFGRCYLPKIEGPQRCNQLAARYWYDYNTRQCSAFWWRGCLGNANNFPTFEDCVRFCSNTDSSLVPNEIRQSALNSASHYRLPPPQQPVIYRPVEQKPLQHPISIVLTQHQQQSQLTDHESAFVGVDTIPSTEFDSKFCLLSVDSGTCHKYKFMYYYDLYSASCYEFIYSGCGGNENKFETLTECLTKCAAADKRDIGVLPVQRFEYLATVPPPSTSSTSARRHTALLIRFTNNKSPTKTKEVCNLRVDVGKCEGHFESWYYEVATGSCEKFQYSGCGGNGNRFNVREQCEELCVRDSVAPHKLFVSPPTQFIQGPGTGAEPSVRTAPKDTGPCKNFVTKWYYNKHDGTCNRFHYGGCEGNANRFETEQECKNTCGEFIDTCLLPVVAGPCAGKNERFYFDYVSRQCKAFEYSGCLGNANNFRLIDECKAKCSS